MITAVELLKSMPQEDVRNIRRILAYLKGVSYEFLMFNPENVILNQEEWQKFEGLLRRYNQSEPLSKITGRKSFWKHVFLVNSDVLDPRPETELIIESVLKYYCETPPRKILDIGTGSGCILLSLLREFEKIPGVGVDISLNAIEVAEKNQAELKIEENRVLFLNVDWNDLPQYQMELKDVDLIVSNPPYIRTSDIAELAENVRKYDPMVALDGGADGLDAYRDICVIGRKVFGSRSGRIFLEVGYDQADDVAEILRNNEFQKIKKIKDLAGVERVVQASFL